MLSRCPIPDCPHRPMPWFCSTHWPFISSDTRARIVRFTKALRGSGEGDLPPTLRNLLIKAALEIADAPLIGFAERIVFWLHRLVVGGPS